MNQERNWLTIPEVMEVVPFLEHVDTNQEEISELLERMKRYLNYESERDEKRH